MKSISSLFVCLVACVATVWGQNNHGFTTFDQVVQAQTERVSAAGDAGLRMQAEAYCERGEAYLYSRQYDLAVNDFQMAHQYANQAGTEEADRLVAFRAVFGEAFAYGNLQNREKTLPLIRTLQEILYSVECFACQEVSIIHHPDLQVDNLPPEGLQFVQTAAISASGFLKFSRAESTPILKQVIQGLEDEALRCSEAGSVWNESIQRLSKKFQEWNRQFSLHSISSEMI